MYMYLFFSFNKSFPDLKALLLQRINTYMYYIWEPITYDMGKNIIKYRDDIPIGVTDFVMSTTGK